MLYHEIRVNALRSCYIFLLFYIFAAGAVFACFVPKLCFIPPMKWSEVAQLCPTLCDPMDCSLPGSSIHGIFQARVLEWVAIAFSYVHQQLPELTQTHAHWIGDAIQPSHPLSSPSPPTFSLSQCQGLFQWVSFSHQVAKVLEFQLQPQSFQWTPRTGLL